MAQKNRVTVAIFGEQYVVISSASPTHLKRLAALVDSQMRRIAERSPRLAPSKVAVLAALSLANEVVRLGGPAGGEGPASVPAAGGAVEGGAAPGKAGAEATTAGGQPRTAVSQPPAGATGPAAAPGGAVRARRRPASRSKRAARPRATKPPRAGPRA